MFRRLIPALQRGVVPFHHQLQSCYRLLSITESKISNNMSPEDTIKLITRNLQVISRSS